MHGDALGFIQAGNFLSDWKAKLGSDERIDPHHAQLHSKGNKLVGSNILVEQVSGCKAHLSITM
jgi:hypothetical protein